jgi:uncharacterized protein YbjQ (UPF0145 family)
MPRQPQGQQGQQGQTQGQTQDQQPIQPDQSSAPVEMPQHAIERLKRMRGGDGMRPLFTSDLSVNEFLLVKEAGFDPVGMVVGSSIYHIGYQRSMFNVSQELGVLSQAMYNARELAMARMEAEADALGADGIVGVRLDVGRYEWGADLAEFIAIGTAVRSRDGANHRTKFGKPFTSDLSGQEFSTLLKAGYRPLGLVMGVSVYAAYQNGYEFQMISGWTYGWTGMGAMGGGGMGSYNQEVNHFTDAMYATRNLAMSRLQREAQELGAEGVVGMRVEVAPSLSKDDPEFWNELNERDAGMAANHWRTFLVDIFALGTAVAPLGTEHQIAKPQMMVFLDK